MAGQSNVTTDHEVIKNWVEERNGVPTIIEGTEGKGKGAGLLRIHFPDYDDGVDEDSDQFEEISWEEFFDTFEEKNLAFLYQEETKGGQESRFFKFVNRDKDE